MSLWAMLSPVVFAVGFVLPALVVWRTEFPSVETSSIWRREMKVFVSLRSQAWFWRIGRGRNCQWRQCAGAVFWIIYSIGFNCLDPICHAHCGVGSRKWNLFRRSACLCRQIGEASCSFRCPCVASRSHTEGNMFDGTWPVWWGSTFSRLCWSLPKVNYLVLAVALVCCSRSERMICQKKCKTNISRHFVTSISFWKDFPNACQYTLFLSSKNKVKASHGPQGRNMIAYYLRKFRLRNFRYANDIAEQRIGIVK